jgi:subtilase family serine protease
MAATAKAATRADSPSTSTVVLTHQVIPNLASYQLLGPSNPDQRVQVGVAIASPKEAEEAAFAKALYTAGSPDFHHFLTADGLSVAYSAPDGRYVLLAGTVGQVERTFSVTEEDHRGLDGTMFRANGNAPTVPLGVNAVLGLSSIGMTRSQDVLYRRWSSAGLALRP